MANAAQSEAHAPTTPNVGMPTTSSNGSPEPASAETYVFPASLEQMRYWMLARLDPSSTASNMAISFDIEGRVDRAVAEEAIAALTLRHEALRTLFRLENGVLSQVIVTRPLYSFSTSDLSQLPAEERAGALDAAIHRHSHTVIDLEHGPVLHALLIHRDSPSATRHVLALTLHHIVCDGWSNGILVRDFTRIYENLRAGRPAMETLPPLPFQFADFALWQSEYLASNAAEQAADFWRSQFAGDICGLDIPADYPRSPGRSFPGHIESALLPAAINDRLSAYCRNTGSTKHIVLLAAFEAFCSVYAGQEQFLLGSTIANRTQPGMDDVVGRFANPRIIVAQVDHTLSFAALEQRVRTWETTAYQHQDLPFSRVIEDMQLDQAAANAQFLQVWFLYQKAFMQPQAGGSIRVDPRRSVSGGVDFDLLVSVVERSEGPRIQCEYNTLLFAPERIQAIIQGLVRLLDAALLQPGLPLSSLTPLLVPVTAPAVAKAATTPIAESGQPAPSSPGETFVSCFLRQRLQDSEASACTDAHGSLTWRELDDRSQSLALTLHRTLPQATAIAVVLAPAVESVVALLAVLRLGLDLVPLPAHTTVDAAAHCLVRFPSAALLSPYKSNTVCGLAFSEFPRSTISGPIPPNPAAPGRVHFLTDADSCSFTSVPIDSVFARVAEALTSIDPALHLNHSGGESTSILCFPAPSPVAACFDLLLALASGAQLNLAEFPGPGQIRETISALSTRHEPTCILATPFQANALASSGWEGDRRIRLVVRDARLPAALALRWKLRLKSVVYLVLAPLAGGPVALQQLMGNALEPKVRSLGMSQLVLTSPDGRPLPHGARGELRLRNQDGVLQPTGLIAQSTPTGGIERLDQSERLVQLRSHKILLGDIEDAAFAFPSVRDAAAILTANDAGPRLTIHVVGVAEQDRASLLDHFVRTLPAHLVPSDVVHLNLLPLQPDGRLDRALLAQSETLPTAIETTEQPANDVEQKLALIWKDVLNLKSLDAQKSFFDLGGSSLSLVRLFARINKTFGTGLPITTIFDAPTVSALAGLLGGRPHISHLVQVQPSGSRPPVFMVHSYLLYQGLSTTLGLDQPFFGLRELEEDGQLKIEQRVQSYVEEIKKIQPKGPYRLAGWCAAGPLTVEVARQLIVQGQQVSYLALFDAWLPGYVESLETARKNDSWLPYKGNNGRLGYHRSRMQGMSLSRRLVYTWNAGVRVIRESRDRFYLSNWQRLHRLAQKYGFSLPPFLHNTSFETFSALKEYQNQRVPIRITLIRARDAREVPGASASCGWEQIAELGVDVIWAPGDHETMFTGERLKVTSDIVRRGLQAAELAHGADGDVTGITSSANQKLGVLHVDCPST